MLHDILKLKAVVLAFKSFDKSFYSSKVCIRLPLKIAW